MAKYRQGRINDALAQETALALRDVRDPRIVSNMVSITRADVTKDLKIAKVYFSCMGDPTEAKRALTGAAGFTRWILQYGFSGDLTSKNTLEMAKRKALG